MQKPAEFLYLAPYEHGAEHDLQAVEEVVSYDDDGGSSGGPSLTGADSLDAWGGCLSKTKREEQIQHLSFNIRAHVSFHKDTLLHHLHVQPSMSLSQRHIMEIAPLEKKK